MAMTMFERCGGFSRLRKLVSSFYDKVLDSPLLQRHFETVDMRALVDHQTKFVAQVMGGPASYSDEVLRRVHAPLGITSAEFREMLGLLRESMEENDFEASDIEHLCREVTRREPMIVTRYE